MEKTFQKTNIETTSQNIWIYFLFCDNSKAKILIQFLRVRTKKSNWRMQILIFKPMNYYTELWIIHPELWIIYPELR